MQSYLQQLNAEQLAAVQHKSGPAIVLAGAGSGKTRVLTTRAAHVLERDNLQPEEILLVTFTNKAAGEMRERVAELTQQSLPFVGTFHSLSAKLLRTNAYALGMSPGFTIYDTDDQLQLIKSIYKKEGFNTKEFNPKAVKAAISAAKNELLTPEKYEEIAYGRFQEFTAKVFKLYERAKKQADAVDFDDLLLLAVQLLRQHPDILRRYQAQFQHVLVDEYQDTNKAQYALTKLLSQPQNNIYIVGDFSQSIYAWRGADYKNLQYFSQDFADSTEYRLEQNYRSSQSILDTATAVISENNSHPILKLWTENTDTQAHLLLEAQDQNQEAELVSKQISHLHSEFSYADIAILYRTNAQSRAFEESFLRHGIPYKVVGGFKFYERKEIKDVLCMLRLASNFQDSVSRERISKVGKRRLKAVEDYISTHLKKYPDLLENPGQLLHELVQVSNYVDLFDKKDPDDSSRLENIDELINTAHQFNSVAQFLENVALVQDDYLANTASSNADDRVSLMSLHSAKGLEFPVVFLVGMEEGLLPHSRSLLDKQQLEEERRLCYVGITRAKKKLFFSYAKRRFSFGMGSNFTTMSRFLAAIPPQLLQQKFAKSSKKHWSPDPEQLDALLDGELDLDSFINS